VSGEQEIGNAEIVEHITLQAKLHATNVEGKSQEAEIEDRIAETTEGADLAQTTEGGGLARVPVADVPTAEGAHHLVDEGIVQVEIGVETGIVPLATATILQKERDAFSATNQDHDLNLPAVPEDGVCPVRKVTAVTVELTHEKTRESLFILQTLQNILLGLVQLSIRN